MKKISEIRMRQSAYRAWLMGCIKAINWIPDDLRLKGHRDNLQRMLEEARAQRAVVERDEEKKEVR